jgi:translation initiation factor 1
MTFGALAKRREREGQSLIAIQSPKKAITGCGTLARYSRQFKRSAPMSPKPARSTLVYSTEPDPQPVPAAEEQAYPSASKQTARIWRDSKRRRGKTVTVIGGLQHDPATLDALLKKLKQQCGAGGSLKDGELEIQGDHRERVAAALAAMGYKIKHVGG